ncbi:MAG TPA: hypothetical protein VHA82_14550 [Ramlibacter sp.]|uniref:hypothetical protein n=1 Tax=Ramlibacter sp. TaxID=1917967 RepID=UPI002C1621EA|nr:hypothetical protein [Ramlibacter sp.]HVZ45027.1 hypothetical protein [Ramlibacter sp.]
MPFDTTVTIDVGSVDLILTGVNPGADGSENWYYKLAAIGMQVEQQLDGTIRTSLQKVTDATTGLQNMQQGFKDILSWSPSDYESSGSFLDLLIPSMLMRRSKELQANGIDTTSIADRVGLEFAKGTDPKDPNATTFIASNFVPQAIPVNFADINPYGSTNGSPEMQDGKMYKSQDNVVFIYRSANQDHLIPGVNYIPVDPSQIIPIVTQPTQAQITDWQNQMQAKVNSAMTTSQVLTSQMEDLRTRQNWWLNYASAAATKAANLMNRLAQLLSS